MADFLGGDDAWFWLLCWGCHSYNPFLFLPLGDSLLLILIDRLLLVNRPISESMPVSFFSAPLSVVEFVVA